MKRRDFITLLGGTVAAWPVLAKAQQRYARIGYLSPTSAAKDMALFGSEFRAGLRDLGYIEGKNLQIESRYADGDSTRLAGLASELVGLKVDVIVTSGPGITATRFTTALIPIVMAFSVGEPIGVWAASDVHSNGHTRVGWRKNDREGAVLRGQRSG